MKITVKEMEILQRQLGIIEGVVCGMEHADVVYDAVESICSVVDNAEVGFDLPLHMEKESNQ